MPKFLYSTCRSFLILVSALVVLAACTGDVVVPSVQIEPQGIPPIKGHYVANLQSGGWNLKIHGGAGGCSAWSFNLPIDAAYSKALQDSLMQTFEHVTFKNEIIKPADLASQGYKGQLSFVQGNAGGRLRAIPGFLQATGEGEVHLTTNFSLVTSSGLTRQYTAQGRGIAESDVFSCSSIGDVLAPAAQNAILDLMRNINITVREAALRDNLR